MHSLLRSVAEIVYPTYCGGCGRKGEVVCQSCRTSFRLVEPHSVCPVCGRWLGRRLVCGDCMEKKTFHEGYYGYYYEDKLRNAIHAFKFSGRKDVGRLLVRELARLIESIVERFDCIVPVPVSASRLRERGFNQSFIIAEEISRITGKTVLTSVLLKTRETEDQYRLEKERRKKNVKGVFAVRNTAKIEDRSVLLVDDLLTTGYTAQEAARTLLRAKVREVIFFGLARTP